LRLEHAAEGNSDDPLFAALGETIRRHKLPLEPFRDLLQAFRRDLTCLRYVSWEDLLDYCRLSANPVGRLVLLLGGESNEPFFAYSDKICTALQLANHWQDVAGDFRRGRIYIPLSEMARFGVSEDAIQRRETGPLFKQMMANLVERTEAMFEEGQALLDLVNRPLGRQLRLYWGGGMAALRAIQSIDYDVLNHRARVGRPAKLRVFIRAALNR